MIKRLSKVILGGRKFMERSFIVDGEGRKLAVVLPIEEYEELMEDLHDLSVIAERKDEDVISFEDVKRELKEDLKP